jgi:hypothetical protein
MGPVAAEVVSSMAATVGGSHSKGRSRVGEGARRGSSGEGHRALGRGAGAAARARPGALVGGAGAPGAGSRCLGRLPARGLERWSRQRVARPRAKGRPRRQAGRRRRGPGEGGAPGRWEGGRRPEVGGRGVDGWVEAGRLEPTAEREKKNLNLAL